MFFTRILNEAKKKRRAEQAVSVEKKLALIEKANALKDSEEWKKTAESFKALMDEWRAAGNSGSEGDKLWEQFSSARQAFFDRQRKHYSEKLNRKHKLKKTVSNNSGPITSLRRFIPKCSNKPT